MKLGERLREGNISFSGIKRVQYLSTPPWELPEPTIDLTLTAVKKGEISPEEFRSLALERIASYRGFTCTYTDGSKTDTGVGCAFVSGNDMRSFVLPPQATVFTAELVAIFRALCFIQISSSPRHVIFTDSLSSLFLIRAFNPSHQIAQDIVLRLSSLEREGKTVVFCWIPSHIGVKGNDLADQAAKRAAQGEYSRFFPLPARDLFSLFSAYVQKIWQSSWDTENSNKLREIKPHLEQWPSCSRQTRSEEVALCRLRIGHTYATHHYLLRSERRPQCPRCTSELSVKHVLISCRELDRDRDRFLGHGARGLSLSDLLNDDSMHVAQVLAFLKDLRFSIVYRP